MTRRRASIGRFSGVTNCRRREGPAAPPTGRSKHEGGLSILVTPPNVGLCYMPPSVEHAPHHVAIIMDGNGRWAKQRGLPRIEGHRRGVETARAIIRAAGELGIKYLTLYAFSAENWNRPKDEVDALMKYLVHYLKSET